MELKRINLTDKAHLDCYIVKPVIGYIRKAILIIPGGKF